MLRKEEERDYKKKQNIWWIVESFNMNRNPRRPAGKNLSRVEICKSDNLS